MKIEISNIIDNSCFRSIVYLKLKIFIFAELLRCAFEFRIILLT